MLWIFGIVVVLVALLVVPNALYAFRQFLANRDLLWVTVYFGFLLLLGYLLLHMTTRTVELVQTAKEVYLAPDP